MCKINHATLFLFACMLCRGYFNRADSLQMLHLAATAAVPVVQHLTFQGIQSPAFLSQTFYNFHGSWDHNLLHCLSQYPLNALIAGETMPTVRYFTAVFIGRCQHISDFTILPTRMASIKGHRTAFQYRGKSPPKTQSILTLIKNY